MNMYMSFIRYTTTYNVDENGHSHFSIDMDDVTTKCMHSFCKDPEEWIKNAIVSRSQEEGNRIYKSELDRHIEAGTMPANPTKESLILGYEIPVSTSTTSNIA